MAAWVNLKIRASASYAHIISDALIELGALSSSIEDTYLNSENEEALFGEPNIPIFCKASVALICASLYVLS